MNMNKKTIITILLALVAVAGQDHTTVITTERTRYRPNSRRTFWPSSPSSVPSMASSSTTM